MQELVKNFVKEWECYPGFPSARAFLSSSYFRTNHFTTIANNLTNFNKTIKKSKSSLFTGKRKENKFA